MAIITSAAAGDVCRRLASRDIAVVTGLASTNYLGVVDHCRWRPNIHAMTIFTNRGCLNVCDMLASRIRTVMAIYTIAGDGRVIKIGWRPANGCVAVVAVVATGEMRRMLASRCDPIVTGAAAAQHLRVIDRVGRQPGNGVMAVFANGCRLYVRRVLAGCVRTVVAIRAAARDIQVIEVGWNPTRCCVTVVAVVAALNMIGVFAGRDISIVARATTSQHAQVVNREYGAPVARRMAVLTNGRGLDVYWRLAGRDNAVVA